MKSWHDVIVAGNNGEYGPRWIKAAAIRLPDGKILTHARHDLIIKDSREQRIKAGVTEKYDFTNQGFLLNTGEYINRKDAAILALSNGQITEKKYISDTLFSEELWSLG